MIHFHFLTHRLYPYICCNVCVLVIKCAFFHMYEYLSTCASACTCICAVHVYLCVVHNHVLVCTFGLGIGLYRSTLEDSNAARSVRME